MSGVAKITSSPPPSLLRQVFGYMEKRITDRKVNGTINFVLFQGVRPGPSVPVLCREDPLPPLRVKQFQEKQPSPKWVVKTVE